MSIQLFLKNRNNGSNCVFSEIMINGLPKTSRNRCSPKLKGLNEPKIKSEKQAILRPMMIILQKPK